MNAATFATFTLSLPALSKADFDTLLQAVLVEDRRRTELAIAQAVFAGLASGELVAVKRPDGQLGYIVVGEGETEHV